MFREGQMVIKEVIMDENVGITEGCSKFHEKCSEPERIFCCEDLTCNSLSGVCDLPCAKFGEKCSGSIPIACCPGLTCHYPIIPPPLVPPPFPTEGKCGY